MTSPVRTRYRLPLALIAAIAVVGAFIQSSRRERPTVEPPLPSASGWSGVRVAERPFAPGAHEDQGDRLYGWNCMPCHGAEGRGDGPVAVRLGLRPADFTRGRFKLKSSHPDEMPFDEDLFRSISAGFPQGAMPSFSDFTVEERWALVDQVKMLARANPAFDAHPAGRRISCPPMSDGDVVRGQALFGTSAGCVQCHGARGRGDGPSAPTLVDADDRPAIVPDFARGEMSFKAGSGPGDVYRVLTTGLAGTAMPSFMALSERDRRDLSLFVTSLYRPVPPGERLFLTKGCIQCHTVGKGRRVGPDLAGIAARRSREWLGRWLTDPPSMLASDVQARAMIKDYPVAMPKLNLTDAEVGQLVEHLMSLPGAPAPAAGARE